MIIKEITLFSNNIQQQKQFYKTVLGFEIIEDTSEKIAFKVGNGVLVFQYKEDVKPSHLAFNIPSNAINDALIWLKQKTEVITYNNEYVSDFSNWKAKAIYFYDTDKNIMEFIARERIDRESDVAFSAQSILSISEVAIATNDIETIYDQINKMKSIPVFDGDFERFCAIGNDEGLFILVNKELKKWYPTNDEALTSDFIIKGDYNFSFINGKIKEIQ